VTPGEVRYDRDDDITVTGKRHDYLGRAQAGSTPPAIAESTVSLPPRFGRPERSRSTTGR
jgi:hypothetical protein